MNTTMYSERQWAEQRLQGILDGIEQRPQRQDSLEDQLRDLQGVANKLGMYDAADFLTKLLDRPRP